MKLRGCSYRNGTRGRSITTRPGVGSATTTAHLTCSGCACKGDLNVRSDATPHQIDQKFRVHGWTLDPHLCPDCLKPKEKPMSSTPTPAAMKAQAQMFQLLTQHFDADNGRFVVGWSDEKIAKDTGLAVELVTNFRRAGFGEIKEPAEISLMRADINTVEQLAREQHGAISAEVATLRDRLAKLSVRFSA